MEHNHSRNSRNEQIKACIFCGKQGPLTKEDYWPKWLQKYLPSPFTSARHDSVIRSANMNATSIKTQLFKNKGLLNNPLKVVCGKCNNGWMSGLQRKVNPYLKPRITGGWQPFTQESHLLISSWATMFTMVYDFADMATQNVTQAERTLLMESGCPPSNWVISYGRLRHDFDHGRVWKRSLRVMSDSDDVIPERFNIQTTTFAVGKLLLHTLSSTAPNWTLSPTEIQSELSIEVLWPAIHWPIRPPHRKIGSHAGFENIAQAIGKMF